MPMGWPPEQGFAGFAPDPAPDEEPDALGHAIATVATVA